MSQILTDTRVIECFHYCLAYAGDPDTVEVQGIRRTCLLSQPRLLEQRANLAQMLGELPLGFRSQALPGGGGGWTFLNMCVDRHGREWAQHPEMELLMMLAIGANLMHYSLPREVWPAVGGVPYVEIIALA